MNGRHDLDAFVFFAGANLCIVLMGLMSGEVTLFKKSMMVGGVPAKPIKRID